MVCSLSIEARLESLHGRVVDAVGTLDPAQPGDPARAGSASCENSVLTLSALLEDDQPVRFALLRFRGNASPEGSFLRQVTKRDRRRRVHLSQDLIVEREVGRDRLGQPDG